MTRRAAVIGTGLIGSSIGIGLTHAGWRVVGWDPDPVRGATAKRMGAVDAMMPDIGSAVADVNLVMLAGPVSAILEQVATIETPALVTDVAGVKSPIVAAAPDHLRFVGGHPMAGRETTGPDGASGSMFRGAAWVVTTDGAEEADLVALEEIVNELGAHPMRKTAREHDRAVAAASHLPHVTAATLVNQVAEDVDALSLTAGGFRDLTRVAMSEPGWWVDVLVANGDMVGASLRDLAARLTGLAYALETGDQAAISGVLGGARDARRAMTAPVETIGVLLDDRPGEIARVGHALSESGVDLRDLQLRHAIHGGGGVLTLSVRFGEAEALRVALAGDGFRLVV